MGSFLVHGGTLEPYLSKFDVEKHEMASVMGICASLVGPKSENVEKVLVFKRFLKGQGSHGYARESLQPSEPEYFGALLGSLLDTLGSLLHDLGYMRVTLESFWSNFGKHLFFQQILMILCIYGVSLTSL